jgi:hypothetical protein
MRAFANTSSDGEVAPGTAVWRSASARLFATRGTRSTVRPPSGQRTFRDDRDRPVYARTFYPVRKCRNDHFRAVVPASPAGIAADRVNQKIDEHTNSQRKLASKWV